MLLSNDEFGSNSTKDPGEDFPEGEAWEAVAVSVVLAAEALCGGGASGSSSKSDIAATVSLESRRISSVNLRL